MPDNIETKEGAFALIHVDLSFENHDMSFGLTCPGCGHQQDFATFSSDDLNVVARGVPAPYVLTGRTLATVYECRECFEKFWFHQ